MSRKDDHSPSALERAGYVGAGALSSLAAPMFAHEIAKQVFDEELKREAVRTPEFFDALGRIRGHAAVKADAPFPVIVKDGDTAYYPNGRHLLNEHDRVRMPEVSRGLIGSDGRLAGLLHELGHATGSGGISKGRAQLITQLYNSVIPTALAAGVALPNRILSASDDDVKEYERGLAAISLLPTALAAPTLYEEARANLRGAGFARKFGYDVPAKRFLLPMATYAASPLAASAALYGIGRLALRRRHKNRDKDQVMKKTAMEKLAQIKDERDPWYKRIGPGAIGAGALGLAGVGLGLGKHLNVRKLRKDFEGLSNTLGNATKEVDRLKPLHGQAETSLRAADTAYADELREIMSTAGDNESLRETLFRRLGSDADFISDFVEPQTQARAKLRTIKSELDSADSKRSSAAKLVNVSAKQLGDETSKRNLSLGLGGLGLTGAGLSVSGSREEQAPRPSVLGVRQ